MPQCPAKATQATQAPAENDDIADTQRSASEAQHQPEFNTQVYGAISPTHAPNNVLKELSHFVVHTSHNNPTISM